jgi:hypothetical protein
MGSRGANGLMSTTKIALRNVLAVSKAKELSNLGALAYEIRREWEDRVKKVVLSLGGGEELDCM